MVNFNSLGFLAVMGSALAAPQLGPPQLGPPQLGPPQLGPPRMPPGPPGMPTLPCGRVNVLFTGLPHDHPAVIAGGWDTNMVLHALKADAARILQAGYNLKVVFLGPEVGIPALEEQYRGIPWHAAVTGFGIRGSNDPGETYWFADIQNSFKRRIPRAELLYNWSPNSTLAVLNRSFPLPPNCPPGRDFGYTEICAANVCKDAGNSNLPGGPSAGGPPPPGPPGGAPAGPPPPGPPPS